MIGSHSFEDLHPINARSGGISGGWSPIILENVSGLQLDIFVDIGDSYSVTFSHMVFLHENFDSVTFLPRVIPT